MYEATVYYKNSSGYKAEERRAYMHEKTANKFVKDFTAKVKLSGGELTQPPTIDKRI